MKRFVLPIIVLSLFFGTSCLVQAPKFSNVEKVLGLELGQTPEQVSNTLGIPPYNFISENDSESVLLYKYRVYDRTTLPFMLKETNGKKTRGRYVNLVVTYHNGISTKMKSCDYCDESQEKEKRFDFNKVMNVLTVTLPLVLVFLGIQKLQ